MLRLKTRTCAVLLAVAALAAPLTVPAVAQASSKPASIPADGWIIQNTAITELGANGLSQADRQALFGHPNTYIIMNTADPGPLTVTGATLTYSYSSEAALASAVQSGLPANIGAVMLDIEYWPATPPQEQFDPVHYIDLAASIVHQAGLKFIAAPAPDLTTSADPGYPCGNYPGYIALGLAGDSAQVSDVVDIQAQQLELRTITSPPGCPPAYTYAPFIHDAAAQAQAAGPDAILMAGLTTSSPVTCSQLTADYNSVSSYVLGYWLNVPADPGVGVEFLESLLSGIRCLPGG